MGNTNFKGKFFKSCKFTEKEIFKKIFEFHLLEEEDINFLFNNYDKNKNGVLEWDEAEPFLTEMIKLTIKRVRNENEKIKNKGEWEEKQLEWAVEREKNLPKYVKELFDSLDVDKSGTIDRKEFAAYL
jgi:Ca2+-binding EF-hand superfamily protein